MKFKYLIFKDSRGIELPIIFSKFIDHDSMWRRYGRSGDALRSAGFLEIDNSDELDPKFHCYGKSVSLGIESRPEDTNVVNKDYQFRA